MTDQQTPATAPVNDSSMALEMLDRATSNGGAPDELEPGQPEILRHMAPSGLRQTYVVEMNDGSFMKVKTNAQDVVRYETVFQRGWFDESGVSLTRLLYTAWAGLVRTGADLPKFNEWYPNVEDIYVEQQDTNAGKPVNPTLPIPGDG